MSASSTFVKIGGFINDVRAILDRLSDLYRDAMNEHCNGHAIFPVVEKCSNCGKLYMVSYIAHAHYFCFLKMSEWILFILLEEVVMDFDPVEYNRYFGRFHVRSGLETERILPWQRDVIICFNRDYDNRFATENWRQLSKVVRLQCHESVGTRFLSLLHNASHVVTFVLTHSGRTLSWSVERMTVVAK